MLKNFFFSLAALAWVVFGLLGLVTMFAGSFLLGVFLLACAWGCWRLAVKCDPDETRAHV